MVKFFATVMFGGRGTIPVRRTCDTKIPVERTKVTVTYQFVLIKVPHVAVILKIFFLFRLTGTTGIRVAVILKHIFIFPVKRTVVDSSYQSY